jgi:glycine cleavage system regulatory protein
LGDEFIIMMHVSVEPDKTRSLLQAVQKNKDLLPLNIKSTTIKRRYTSAHTKPMSAVRIRCVGEDK